MCPGSYGAGPAPCRAGLFTPEAQGRAQAGLPGFEGTGAEGAECARKFAVQLEAESELSATEPPSHRHVSCDATEDMPVPRGLHPASCVFFSVPGVFLTSGH